MRTLFVLFAALALISPVGAVRLAPDPVGDATRMTDDVVARLSALPDGRAGVLASTQAALALAGHTAAPLVATQSASLQAALLGLYEALGVEVDAALVASQARAVPATQAASLAAIVDAVADAHRASARILPAQDIAALQDDLRTQLLLFTLREDRSLVTVLARADMTQAAAAALRLSEAIGAAAPAAEGSDCAMVLDLPFVQVGGACDDTYTATNVVQIDHGGNDVYLNNAGAGIAGVGAGLAIDYGAGADTYRAAAFAQGAALAGAGILYDEGGSDLYNLSQFGQGFATAGFALLYDAGAGDDVYESGNAADSIGTKAGGLGGVGVLVDEGGRDLYQQDGLDGFVYGAAGGLGLLVEQGSGNDVYLSRDLPIVLLGTPLGDFVGPIQVSAEVSATAILYEEGGDDAYTCGDHVRQGCQGAGGVGGIALHLDLAGNDVYRLGQSISPLTASLFPVFPSGQGIAYGQGSAPPGPGLGVLRDYAGDDVYVGGAWSQGYATGGLGLLRDEAGEDSYHAFAPLVGSRADGQTWADGLALGVGLDLA